MFGNFAESPFHGGVAGVGQDEFRGLEGAGNPFRKNGAFFRGDFRVLGEFKGHGR